MKAAYIDQAGPPQTIHYGDLPLPSVGKRDALVKVLAVDVNAVDTYIVSGQFKTPLPSLPLSQAAKAYEIYETEDLFGKLVLSPQWETN
jgi:NADPH:quinone reductase-like Zn-dependent oxidoreductase